LKDESDVLSAAFQNRWKDHPIYDETILSAIDKRVRLHSELRNVRSSAAACINTIGNISVRIDDLIAFLSRIGLSVECIIPFPKGATLANQRYDDEGNVIFEWIGPKLSPLNERGGERGARRTSIDAFILAIVNGKVTQLLLEWKFSESYASTNQLQKFAGVAGNERLRRYSSCLAELRRRHDFPLRMKYEGGLGLYDLGYEPLYQLLRMTLLAKLTTPLKFSSGITVEDYRVVHLSHSGNVALNVLSEVHVRYTPGLRRYAGSSLHDVWKNRILSNKESNKFCCGYWDEAIGALPNGQLKDYLIERYVRHPTE
jgi:hypothetical protein